MKRHKFSEESISRKRRIEELREREAGYKADGDTIYDGGEIALSPSTDFHRAAMGNGEDKGTLHGMNGNMIELIGLKIAAGAKMAASLIPGSVPIMLAANGVIGNETGLSLAIVGSVVGGAWYLNGRLTRIESSIEELKHDMSRLPCGKNDCHK